LKRRKTGCQPRVTNYGKKADVAGVIFFGFEPREMPKELEAGIWTINSWICWIPSYTLKPQHAYAINEVTDLSLRGGLFFGKRGTGFGMLKSIDLIGLGIKASF